MSKLSEQSNSWVWVALETAILHLVRRQPNTSKCMPLLSHLYSQRNALPSLYLNTRYMTTATITARVACSVCGYFTAGS